MTRRAYTVSLYVAVDDPDELIAAGKLRAVEDGVTAEDCDDVPTALRFLFDPGTPPPGCKIFDSEVEGGES